MREISADIVADIDSTLNELLQIAELLKSAKLNHHFFHEVEALEKTQESLLARLMHRQSLLDMENRKRSLDSLKKEAIEKKVVEYARSQKRARLRSARSKS
jgi:ABC-type iron transport system FetAB ATPase subunit